MRIDQVITYLQKNVSPFTHLDDDLMDESKQALRVFEIFKEEKLSIKARRSSDTLFLINGSVQVSDGKNKKILNSLNTAQNKRQSKHLVMPKNQEALDLLALEKSLICHVDHEFLEHLISWNELSQNTELNQNERFNKYIHILKDSLALRHLPYGSVEEAFKLMQEVNVIKNDEVVKQGEQGDAFYLILEGTAEVWQQGLYDDEPIMVAQLTVGDAFGEESLVIEGTRNATIKMTSDGQLLTLSKEHFDKLVTKHSIDWVSAKTAQVMLEQDYAMLDVRYEEEYDDQYIPGSLHIPLPELRQRIDELDKKQKYVILCAGGKRASVANLLLTQRGFNISTIEGGINSWPYETASNY